MSVSSSYPKTPYDPSVTGKLADWRKEARVSQTAAATFFGLRGRRSRETISNWENGKAKPGDDHQERFVDYLWHKLQFHELSKQKEYQYLLVDLWDEIMVGQWEWPPLNVEKLWPYIPYALKYILRDPSQSPPFLFPPKDYEPYGRDELFADLKTRLQPGQRLALYGMAAIGKTTLAVALAHDPEILNRFPDGVLWVGLGQQADQTKVFQQLRRWGEHLGLSEEKLSKQTNIVDLSRVIHDIIGRRRVLLVIDDAWNIQLANDFQIGGPNCTHLLTTRYQDIALDFANGGAVNVPLLDLDQRESLVGHLFPDLDVGELRPLIETVGGVPFSLILVGRYIRNHKLSALEAIKALEDRKQLLDEGRPMPPLKRTPSLEDEALTTLRALIALSYNALTVVQQGVVLALAVFPPDPNTFSLAAALHIAESSEEVLASFISHQDLIQSQGDRYTLHQTTSAFLADLGIGEAIYRRLVEFFVDLVGTHPKEFTILDSEVDNIFAALEAARVHNLNESFIQGANDFYHFLEVKGLYTTAKELLRQAENDIVSLGKDTLLIDTLINLSRIEKHLGQYNLAEDYLERGLKVAKRIDDVTKPIDLYANLGAVLDQKGHYAQAQTFFQRSLNLARTLDDQSRVSFLLTNLCVNAIRQGDYDQAKSYANEGLAMAKAINDLDRVCALLANLGNVALNQGNFEEATQHFQEGLEIARNIEARERTIVILLGLGAITGNQGDYSQAITYLTESLYTAREIGDKERICTSLYNLGTISINQGNFEKAETYLVEGVTIGREINQPYQICLLLASLGLLELSRNNLDIAEAYLLEGVEISRTLNDPEKLSYLLSQLGSVKLSQEDYEQAETYASEATLIARQAKYDMLVSNNLNVLGEARLKLRKLDVAQQDFQEALVIARNLKHSELIAYALFGLSQTAAHLGDSDKAKSYGHESVVTFESISHHKTMEVQEWLESLTKDILESK